MPSGYYVEEEGPSAPALEGICEDPDEDTLRVMVSTDNHLGYEENDSVRGMDSFAAFEEVLYLAKRFRCDMVLLAGDLFHENRPSRRTIYKTMEIIRRYCMGPNPVRIQITSDPAQNFRTMTGKLNYQDENFAVDLPIFTIHGNHDDPTRDGGDLLAALDLLAISNMVNYFGCQERVDDVRLYPAMLQKGTTQLALYGLGSMRDERLNRMWREGKVKFFRFEEGGEGENEDDGVFNMFVLHQNRDQGRGTKSCVQETLIPDFCDLVVWGHEHECLIDFAESLVGTFRISQPGSSVATSLVAGEAVRKKVGVLDIKGKNFRMHKIPLTQVRAFVMSEISLREHRANLDPDDSKIDIKVTKVLEEQVNAVIMDANEERRKMAQEARQAGSNAGEDDSPLVNRLANPEKVLVRLRVEHTGFSTLNNQRFGAKFVDEVANPDNILLFHRKKQPKTVESKATRLAREALRKPTAPDELERTNLEDLVSSLLELPGSKLELLSGKNLGDALELYVEKNDLQSIPSSSEEQLRKRQKMLISNKDLMGKSEETKEALTKENEGDAGVEATTSASASSRGKKRSKQSEEKKDATFSDEDEDNEQPTETTSRAMKSSSSSKASANRRKKQLPESDQDDDEVIVVDEEAPRAKGRSRRTTKKVNYSVDEGDDDDDNDSDAVVDMEEADEDDDDANGDDDEEVKPKGRKVASLSTRGKKTTTSVSRRKPASTRKTSRKKRFADSDDEGEEEDVGGSIGLDADWGSAVTRSQF